MPVKPITNTSAWSKFSKSYKLLAPPLVPSATDVALFEQAIAGWNGSVLLLGVTPSLAGLGTPTIAVDNSEAMLEHVWPRGPERCALRGNWLNLPFAASSFQAVVGDGVMNVVDREIVTFLSEIKRILTPQGIAVFRSFCSPETPEDLEAIHADVLAGKVENFHTLKWRIAMSLAGRNADFSIPVADIRRVFDEWFPDRHALQRRCKWRSEEIAMIDNYCNATHRYSFLPISRIHAVAKNIFSSTETRFASGYPLAERCPCFFLK